MAVVNRGLSGIAQEVSLGTGGSKIKSNSDGIVQVTNNAGSLGKLLIADGTASGHAVTKSQLDAILDGAPAALDTLNELAASIGDDADYAGTVTALVNELNTDVTDIVTAIGIAENASHLGTFTGSTISDNGTGKAALQALETAVELRATAADAALTGTTTAETLNATGNISADKILAKGSGHIRLEASTGNDLMVTLAGQETLQVTRSNQAGNPTTFTAGGGSKDFVFNQNADFKDGVDVTGNITVTGTVDGVDVAALETAVNGCQIRHVDITNSSTSADFGDVIPSGAYIENISVKITTAFGGGSSPALTIGDTGNATGYASISTGDLGSVQRVITNDSAYAGTVLSGSSQPTYVLSGSPTSGAATIVITCRTA